MAAISGDMPGKLLNSRRYQSNLPAISKHAMSDRPDYDANTKLQHKQDRQKYHYDQTSRALPPVYPQDAVRVYNPLNSKWEAETVQVTSTTPRSYTVNMSRGGTLTRNRRHIRPTGETVRPNIPALPTPTTSDDLAVDNKPNIKQEQSTPSSPIKPNDTTPPTPPVRRSTRLVKPTDKLNL
ncbi:hypothetical protein AC249_AIPGENE1058 [Exaiptasia diaphana]|nr:hypothetical protein AC249_AIPGENE1058 [Exaiptasia diaphana]